MLWGKGFLGFEKKEVDPGDVKGTSLKILKYPHPQLRAENVDIREFDEKLEKLAKEMLLVMYASDGIGLAAPQVGVNLKLMVFNENGSRNKNTEMILCNPKIVTRSPDTDSLEEGCLSFPQINGQVVRHTSLVVQYEDLRGVAKEVKLEGLPARIFQHEYDHLDKVLFIDRMQAMDRLSNQKRLDKYVKRYGPGAAP